MNYFDKMNPPGKMFVIEQIYACSRGCSLCLCLSPSLFLFCPFLSLSIALIWLFPSLSVRLSVCLFSLTLYLSPQAFIKWWHIPWRLGLKGEPGQRQVRRRWGFITWNPHRSIRPPPPNHHTTDRNPANPHKMGSVFASFCPCVCQGKLVPRTKIWIESDGSVIPNGTSFFL